MIEELQECHWHTGRGCIAGMRFRPNELSNKKTEKSLNQKRSGYWSTGAGKWIDRVNMTTDHQLQHDTDSAIVAIRNNKSQQSQDDHWQRMRE
jgi:hypothetical protein